MNKLDSLRAAIVEALPELSRDPARLRLWVERGSAQCQADANLSFTFTYRVNVLVLELGTDIALLTLAIFRWLQVNQPERMAPGATGFEFDQDVLDNAVSDVQITIDLTQNVSVKDRGDGGYDLQYLPEPAPLFSDDLGFGGMAPIPLLRDVQIDGSVKPA